MDDFFSFRAATADKKVLGLHVTVNEMAVVNVLNSMQLRTTPLVLPFDVKNNDHAFIKIYY